MANITTYLSNILSAVFGEEVRGSIHDAILVINEESSDAKKAATDAQNSASNSATAAKISETNAESSALSASSSAKLSESYAHGDTGERDGEEIDNSKYYCYEASRFRDESRRYMEQASATVNGPSIAVFIQVPEPNINNCIWIKSLNSNPLAAGTVLLELSDSLDSSNYYVEIDEELKAIENVVDSESELTDGSYMFDFT